MRKAVCTGSFDPVTLGHIDIFRRAAKLFDEVTVCVFHNVKKQGLFSVEERVRLIKESTRDIENLIVDSFSGLVAEYLRKSGASVIVRGIRPGDFSYEATSAHMNGFLLPEAETVFLLADPAVSYISSSAVREIFSFGGNVDGLVPPCVKEALMKISDK